MNSKVVVAMSGGVDSSVVAALLKNQKYNVIGMMLRLWSESSTKPNKCCNEQAVNDARAIAGQLDIPFYYIDIREEFKKKIVNNYLMIYSSGLTPNPCFSCNKNIRYGILLDKAKELGATYLATGHYAKIKYLNDKYYLLSANDKQKDQSYMLYQLSQNQLKHALFPLGEYHKNQVRQLAVKYGFSLSNKKDSQDLCFLGNDGQAGFIKRHLTTKSGEIVDFNGNILGTHKGLAYYTIGQRKGIGINGVKPYYVVKLDIKNNKLVVAFDEQRGSFKFRCNKMHFISDKPDLPFNCQVKIRYKSPLIECNIEKINETHFDVLLKAKIKDITPGQGAVFYKNDIIIGGGTIL